MGVWGRDAVDGREQATGSASGPKGVDGLDFAIALKTSAGDSATLMSRSVMS